MPLSSFDRVAYVMLVCFPKHIPITKDNMMDIKTIQHKLNSRPRKNLNYQKPFDVFYKFVNGKIAFAS
jgi:IS30 family transposase